MSFEIFASPDKGRTAVDINKVVALVDVKHEDTNNNSTLLKMENGTEIVLGTKFSTVLKKFSMHDNEE